MLRKSHIVLCSCSEEVSTYVFHSTKFLSLQVGLPVCQLLLIIKNIFVLYSCWYGGSQLNSCRWVNLLSTMTHCSESLTKICTLTLFTSLMCVLLFNICHSIIGCWLSGLPCVQRQEHYSHIDIRVVPWIPFVPIGGFLGFVGSLHYWLLFKGSLSWVVYILCMWETYFVMVLSIFHPIPSKYLAFCYSLCWLMGDVLISSFQQISSYWLQCIFLWDMDVESLLLPWGL